MPEAAAGKPIEIWFQDEARVGQKGTLEYVWAPVGSRPAMVRDNRHDSAYLFGAVCQARAVGAAVIMPAANSDTMNEHLAEISTQVSPGAHAVLVCDSAGASGSVYRTTSRFCRCRPTHRSSTRWRISGTTCAVISSAGACGTATMQSSLPVATLGAFSSTIQIGSQRLRIEIGHASMFRAVGISPDVGPSLARVAGREYFDQQHRVGQSAITRAHRLAGHTKIGLPIVVRGQQVRHHTWVGYHPAFVTALSQVVAKQTAELRLQEPMDIAGGRRRPRQPVH